MARKGFMYSMFAVLVIGLLISIVSSPLQIQESGPGSEMSRVDETFYFLSSVKNDAGRSTRIIAKRAFSSAINYVATGVSPLENSEKELSSAFINGTINGSEQSLMGDTSFEDWNQSMAGEAERSGYNLEIKSLNVDFSPYRASEGLVNVTYRVNLSDPRSDSQFVRNLTLEKAVDVTNMSDPLLYLQTGGEYSRGFSRCRSDTRASQVSTGSEKFYTANENWTSGEAITRPGNGDTSGVEDKNGKIAVVDDVCSYTDSEISTDLSAFEGVVSEDSGGISDDGSTICGGADSSGFDAYIGGASDSTGIDNESQTVMNEEDFWRNNMKKDLENGCYFDDPTGPTVNGRLEGRLVKKETYSPGWGSFLFIPDLPPEFQDSSRSALDYAYFNDSSYGDNHKIKGVTDHYSWFKLDQQHVDEWGINALTYE